MTCIAAIEDGGRVWLAADTAITGSDGSKDSTRGKVWIDKSGVGIGTAGGYATMQAIKHGFKVPRIGPKMTGMEWCVKRVIPAIRQTVSEIDRDEDGLIDLQMIIVLGGCIYEIDPQLSVSHSPRGYTAIGSGCDFALGSLFSTRKQKPKTRACLAVEAACAHHAGCALPIELICVGGEP